MNSWKKRGYLLLISLFFLVLAELTLSRFYFQPYLYYPSQWYDISKSNDLLKGFHQSKDGIFKIDTNVRASLLNNPGKTIYDNWVGELVSLKDDKSTVLTLKEDMHLTTKLKEIFQKTKISRTDLENEIINYCYLPINKDGFKSIEFKNYSNSKPSILLLGDSFTWGHNATNRMNGFADILLSKGYTVFNTGISGADPLQYKLIAEKYIEQLSPDFVIINFFMGNDYMNYKRDFLGNQPLYYATKQGNLYSNYLGINFESPMEVVEFIRLNYGIPLDSGWHELFGGFRITTLMWKFVGFQAWLNNNLKRQWQMFYELGEKNKVDASYTAGLIHAIKKNAEKNNSTFIFSVIPERSKTDVNLVKNHELFGFFENFYIPELNSKDYHKTDEHFNDSGHKKYADHLIEVMNKKVN